MKTSAIAVLNKNHLISSETDAARDLFNTTQFGTKRSGGIIIFSYLEALYLVEKERLLVVDGKGKSIPFDSLYQKCKKWEKKLFIRYAVFKDFRERGYIIKTALKFGADFRVYDRGVKPGDDHARWIVYPVHESDVLTWYDFASKNRVAHSTKKNLLIAVVDDDADVSYYEVAWVRP